MHTDTALPGMPLRACGHVFACPACRTPLTERTNSVTCSQCGRQYIDPAEGYPDFVGEAAAPSGSHAPLRLQDEVIARRYESCSRPYFFDIMGGNWGGKFTDDDERRYLHGALVPTSGVVADVACGAGRWTRMICNAVGTSRVAAVDISRPLIRQCRAVVPGIAVARASALELPFLDACLGAIVIWNALQQMPDPGKVITEAARCLGPGGILVMLTYRAARAQPARYFQAQHEKAFGVASFTERQISEYLRTAGLRPADISGPANFLQVTALKH